MVPAGRGPGPGSPLSLMPSCACSAGTGASAGHRDPVLRRRPRSKGFLSSQAGHTPSPCCQGGSVCPAPRSSPSPTRGRMTKKQKQTLRLHKCASRRQGGKLGRPQLGPAGSAMAVARAGRWGRAREHPLPPCLQAHPLPAGGGARPGPATGAPWLRPNAVPARPCRRHSLHPAGGVPPVLG